LVRREISIKFLNTKRFVVIVCKKEDLTKKNISNEEAIAWAIKYLIVASTEGYWILLIRRGAILIKLISSPIQAENQEEEETVIKVPRISDGIKIKCFKLIIIKKKNVVL